MTLREEAVFTLEQVPEFKLSELIHYMRFLCECPVNLGEAKKPRGKPRNLSGALKGKIQLADDFEDGFALIPESEYMALKEAAGMRNIELQEAAI